MISMELDLATKAPHDLVLLDGSFIILLIYLNQGLTSGGEAPRLLRDEFQSRWREENVLDRFVGLLGATAPLPFPSIPAEELADLKKNGGLPETTARHWQR